MKIKIMLVVIVLLTVICSCNVKPIGGTINNTPMDWDFYSPISRTTNSIQTNAITNLGNK